METPILIVIMIGMIGMMMMMMMMMMTMNITLVTYGHFVGFILGYPHLSVAFMGKRMV